jgi:hypothetical protein
MKGKLDLIMFNVLERTFGIDSEEIVKVVSRQSTDAGDFDRIAADGKGGDAGRFGELIGNHDPLPYDTWLIVRALDGREILVAVPGEVDCVTVQAAELIPVPDYLRKKQDPFFVWGYIRKGQVLASCVTFCDFRWDKVHE